MNGDGDKAQLAAMDQWGLPLLSYCKVRTDALSLSLYQPNIILTKWKCDSSDFPFLPSLWWPWLPDGTYEICRCLCWRSGPSTLTSYLVKERQLHKLFPSRCPVCSYVFFPSPFQVNNRDVFGQREVFPMPLIAYLTFLYIKSCFDHCWGY